MIYLGSYAAKMQGVDLGRDPLDFDVLGTYPELEELIACYKGNIKACYPTDHGNKYIIKTKGGKIIEFEIAWEGSNSAALIDLIKNDTRTKYHTLTEWKEGIASIDVLLMLKLSHRYKKNSPHFLKTMRDIHALRDAGAVVRPEWNDWFKWREEETYKNHLPKLNVSKDAFFKDDFYIWQHDDIHEAVKHLDRPAYTYFKPENSEVMCDKGMWDACDKKIKLLAVLEESYVLALERSQIPFPETDRKKSFDMALEKVCTSITSGWFREFSWENYFQVEAMYDEKYVDKFQKALYDGLIKPFKGSSY